MIIDDDREFVFIHIPKNAGTSITQALGYKKGDCKINTSSVASCHWTLQELYENNKLKDKEHYYKFAFVRNPWCRMVSMFFFRDEPSFKKIGYLPKCIKKFLPHCVPRADDFPRFIEHVYNFYKDNNQSKDINVRFLLPQHSFIEYKEKSLDFIGRVENLNDDWAYVFKQLDVKQPPRHANSRKHKHYSAYYDKKSIDRVNEMYVKDIEYFGYSFENE